MNRETGVAGLVLAAGGSRRMGRPKMLLPFGSSTVIRTVVDAAASAGLDPIVVVAGPHPDEIRQALTDTTAVVVENPRHEEGQSTSLAAGLRALESNELAIDAVAVLLGDEPGVRPSAIRSTVARWRESGVPAARADYLDRPGHPVVFALPGPVRPEELEGDRGARPILDRPGDHLLAVPIDTSAPVDVDTPAAYRLALERHGRRSETG